MAASKPVRSGFLCARKSVVRRTRKILWRVRSQKPGDQRPDEPPIKNRFPGQREFRKAERFVPDQIHSGSRDIALPGSQLISERDLRTDLRYQTATVPPVRNTL